MSNKQKWVDGDGEMTVGSKGFLTCNHHELKGWSRYKLRDMPPKTNSSFEDRPYGWCGTYDNIATYGEGVWEVIRIAKNGRALLQEITDTETLAGYLDETGYPDLLDEMLEHIHQTQH